MKRGALTGERRLRNALIRRRANRNTSRVHRAKALFSARLSMNLQSPWESNQRETNRSVTNFEDALEHDTHAYREARHAEDQASRCLVSSKYTDQ